MKKVILKVLLTDDRSKQKAMKSVSGLKGVESISMDMKEQKMTVIGDIDPVDVVNKLRKISSTEILSVETAKEVKNFEPKKEEPKKEEKKCEVVPNPMVRYPAYSICQRFQPMDDDVAKLENAYQAYNPYNKRKKN